MNSFYDKIFPFTTESISGYIEEMDVKDKTVLTVGSSVDQALSACLNGAKDITLMDISKQTDKYIDFKLDKIEKTDTPEELYESIVTSKNLPLALDECYSLKNLRCMCPYLKDVESYKKLKENLKDTSIKFVEGNIFDMDGVLGEKTYDRMILSNVFQYLHCYYSSIPVHEAIRLGFNNFKRHLSEEGVLQLLYIYHYCKNNHFEAFSTLDILTSLDDMLGVWTFDNCGSQDATLVYKKK